MKQEDNLRYTAAKILNPNKLIEKHSSLIYNLETSMFINLAQLGEKSLIARSQAKRIYARFEAFKHIILDFDTIEIIGQAFSDELFRVFISNHPNVNLYVENYTAAIKKMILHANPNFQNFFEH